jgi:hypothetical protein
MSLLDFLFNDDDGTKCECIYGSKVEDHAVYCRHPSDRWRKCKLKSVYGSLGFDPSDCPGFEKNPNYKKGG